MAQFRPKMHQIGKPTAAECLKQNRDSIMAEWSRRARMELPPAQEKTHFILIDSLPQFIEQMIASLSGDAPRLAEVIDISEGHALQRSALTDYDLENVLQEYFILRQVIFDLLDREVHLTPRERDIILDVIQKGMAAAARRYSEQALYRESEISAALRRTEQRLTLALRSAKMGVWDWDLATGTLYWSDQLKSMWGYRVHEFPGTIDGFRARIHPEDRERVEAALAAVVERREEYNVEFRVVWPDDSVHWVLAQGVGTLDEKGAVSRMSGAAVDITERVEAKIQLERSEELFRLASQATQDLIWDWRLDTNQIFWNEAIVRQLGYPPSMRQTDIDWWGEHIHSEDRSRVLHGIHEALQGNESRWSDEYRFQDAGGHYRVMVDRGLISRTEAGKAVRMVGAMQDITEPKNAEDALKQSEQRFRRFFENAPVGMAEVDAATMTFIRVNAKYCEMLECTPEELGGLHEEKVTHPEDRRLDAEFHEELASGKAEEVRFEKRYVRRDGKVIWADVSVRTIRDHEQRPIRNLSVVTDITSRVEALEALRRERELREYFASTLTHDLRAPLTSSLMYAQLIARRPDDPDRIASQALKIRDSLLRADKMLQDLLDASRLRGGQRLGIEVTECDFSALAREVRDELIATYGANFVLEAPQELKGFWSCHELRRVLENLGGNAAKYGDTRYPIRMRLTLSNDEVTFTIHNFGNPIPRENLGTIFDSFLRARGEGAKVKGWGLGLSLVKGAVEAHGGKVSVESEPESGTTFMVRLPLDARKFA